MSTSGQRGTGRPLLSVYDATDPAVRATGLVCEHLGLLLGRRGAYDTGRSSSCGVLLLTDGRGWIRTDRSGELRVEEASLYWFGRGTTHSYGPDSSWTEQWLAFSGPVAEQLVEVGAIDLDRPVVPLRGAVEVLDCFAHLRRDARVRRGAAHLLAAATVLRLVALSSWLRTTPGPPGGAGGQVDALRRLAREWADDPAGAGPLPPELAALPPRRLRAEFRTVAGATPAKFLLEARLDRARELLADTDLSVAAVAQEVGFSSASYFSRLFLRREGTSPTAWRQHRRQDG